MFDLIVAVALAASFEPETPSDQEPATRDVVSEPDSRAIQAARDYLIASHFADNMRMGAHHVAQAMIGAMVESAENERQIEFPDDLESELRLIIANHIEAFVDAVEASSLDDAAQIYARHFAAEELQELSRLHGLPVMAKRQGLVPQLTAELADIGAEGAQERQAELEREVMEAIEAWLSRQSEAARPAV